MAISCHSKVFLPSKSIFKQQEETSTLPAPGRQQPGRKPLVESHVELGKDGKLAWEGSAMLHSAGPRTPLGAYT